MEGKKPWLSRTLWAQWIMAGLALFVPGAHEWSAAHPEAVIMIFTLANTVLRLVTKDKIQLWG